MRLFAAIPLPDELGEQLQKLQIEIPGAWWLPASMYHITLLFLGAHLTDEQLPTITRSLAAVTGQPFEIELKGLTRFRTPDWSGVVVAKVDEHPALSQLYTKIAAAMEALGLELETERPFVPHVTLVHVGDNDVDEIIAGYISRNETFHSAPIYVREFVLYELVDTHDGTDFVSQAVFKLSD